MKIAITADLHYTPQTCGVITDFIQRLSNHDGIDVLAVLGDVADDGIQYFEECLTLFRKSLKSVLMVACCGNHDLWTHDPNISSLDLFRITREKAQALGINWLEHNNIYIDDIALVGSYLHYDYSAKDVVGPCAHLPNEYYSVNKHRVNNDGNFMTGLPSDIEFASQIGSAFQSRLTDASHRAGINKVMVLTHVPCMEEQMTRDPHNFSWSVGTPYFGNLSHQKVIETNPKIVAVVSGHTHIGREAIISRENMPDIRVFNLDSDYYKPSAIILEI